MFCIIKVQNRTIYIISIPSPENSRHWLAHDFDSLLICRFYNDLVVVFLVDQVVKNLLQCRRPEFSPWIGKIPWRRQWQPTLVFLLENSMDRGAFRTTVHGVAKSQTQLSNFYFHFFLEWKIMAVCCHFINFLWKYFYLLNKLGQGQLANPFSYQNFTDLRKQCSVSPSVL